MPNREEDSTAKVRFGLDQLTVWVVIGLLALLGYAYRIDTVKADLRDVDRIEKKIDKLIDCHMNGSCTSSK